MATLGLVLLAGCGLGLSRDRRVWEMSGHETALYEAGVAIRAGDLAALRRAGQALGSDDPVPGLPDDSRLQLDAVRYAGAELAKVETIEAGAQRATALTVHCARCHATLGVPAVRPVGGGTPDQQLWTALAFQDAPSWEAAAPPGPLRDAISWDDRRAAFARALLASPD